MNPPEKNGYSITTDLLKISVDEVHRFLSAETYWAKNIPRATVEQSMRNSICFGIHYDNRLVAFGRIITDKATFAYMSDVYVLKEHRGKGLSKWMVENMMSHPELQGLRRFVLCTADAHALYESFGFSAPAKPEWYMEIVKEGY